MKTRSVLRALPMRCIATLLALLLVGVASAQEVAAVSIPLGVTDLFSFAEATVGYQHFDKEPSSLGYAWTGFDPESGVYFVPEDTPEFVSQVFMHCPWIGGTGVAFADYALRLPPTPRIRIAFQIGMRPTARKTDGVTYTIKAGDKTLFEQHCTWKEFRRFEVDVSEFAGREVSVRLQVGPGPERTPTDDWSLWREVQILAGTEEEVAAARKRAAEEAARHRAEDIKRGTKLAETSLLPLTSHTNDSICPSTLRPTRVSVRKDGDLYLFRCEGADGTITYRFDPRVGLLKGLSVLVNGKELSPTAFAGGPRVHLDGRDFGTPTNLLRTELLDAALKGSKLTCKYRYVNPKTGSSAELTAALWPEGKSLGLEVSGEADRFSGFTARPHGGRPVSTAFAVGGSPVRRPEGVYVATVADLMRSEASGVHAYGTTYAPLTDGTRNAMADRLYLTVTSRYEEALSNLTHKPSPFLAELARRVVLDAWGGTFAENEQWLKDMSRYGLDGFLIIKHVWQRDGYDRSYPNTMPANAHMGGDEALRSLSLAAQELGHRFNVHENYYDYYPNAEDFHAEHCALDPAGKEQRGWDRGPVVAKILKPSRLMEYGREFTPEIKRRYDCDSAYHDIMPTWRVDYDGDVEDAGKIRVTHEYTRELCDYDRELFGGPVVFEAADWRMAGVYDGGSNHGLDTYRTPVAVAYELLKVHPKMSNHGFGYYERWLPWGYGAGWGNYVMTDRELDKYRAYQIAFGRTGFIGQQLMKHAHGVVREYYLMQAFGRAYTGKLAERIRYAVRRPDTPVGQNVAWLDAATAARYGELERLNVEYEGGQQVYVNLADDPWEIGGHTLPENGALTAGPRGEAWTAIRDGQICDRARYGEVTYCDARSHQWQPPTHLPPIEPEVAQLKHVGGNEFELTVNWQVERRPERDYTIFWHFKKGSKIEFQYDHSPPKPATSWPVGGTYTDGPHRLRVKADPDTTRYGIVVGLYDKEGRAPLTRGLDEMRIGTLVVGREGEAAVSASIEPLPEDYRPGTDPARYREGANVDKKIIDFGELATNGAVVLRRTPEGRELIPVPIGEVFTVGLPGDIGSVRALDTAGNALPDPSLSRCEGKTWFETTPAAAKYLITT